MSNEERLIKALNKIILRVRNLKEMQGFYESILNLELLESSDDAVFLRIAPDLDGQTTLHHIVFAIKLSDYKTEEDRLLRLGLDVEPGVKERAHYRSSYVCDPLAILFGWLAMMNACN